MYGSQALADTFFTNYDLADTWSGYSAANKGKALEQATIIIDRQPFIGRKYDTSQTNQFPRYWWNGRDTRYFDLNTSGEVVVPEKIYHATYIQAKFLLDTIDNPTIQALLMGITSLGAGKTNQSLDRDLLPMNPRTLLCREAEELIQPFLLRGL